MRLRGEYEDGPYGTPSRMGREMFPHMPTDAEVLVYEGDLRGRRVLAIDHPSMGNFVIVSDLLSGREDFPQRIRHDKRWLRLDQPSVYRIVAWFKRREESKLTDKD